MVPAPRGAGIVTAPVPKKVLQFAGIDDVFTSSRGSTKTLGNFVKVMGGEEAKDPLKGVDWKSIGSELQKDPSAGTKAVVKKRLPKKIRQIPEFYFLPRRSLPSAIAFYGACIAGGVGAGMLLEVWINKKVREDGGVIWEFDK